MSEDQSAQPRTTPDDPLYEAYAEYSDDDDPRDWDEEDGDYEDCGLMPDGQCLKAGSEECDGECPNRNSEFFVGSRAWCRKHGVKFNE